MEKTVVYRLKLSGVDTAIESMAQLKELQKQYTQELDKAKIGSDRYKQLQGNLAAVKNLQMSLGAETRKAQREQVQGAEKAAGSYRALQAQLTNLKNEYKDLGAEAREGIYGRELKGRIKSLSDDLKSLDRGLGDNQRNVGNYGSAFSLGGASLLKFAGAAGVAVASVSKLISVGTNLIESYNKQAQAEAQLRRALGSQVEVADRLIQKASEFQSKSLVGDEVIIQQQAYLASIGRTEEQINKIIEASLNYSAVTGVSVDSAVKNLSKTFSGLSGELGEAIPAIRTLTKEQLESGAAVELVNQQFAGQAEIASRVGSGPLTQLKNVWGDLQELLGKAIAPAVSVVADRLKGLANLVQGSVSSGGGFVKFQAGLVATVETFSILIERGKGAFELFKSNFNILEAVGLLITGQFSKALEKGRAALDGYRENFQRVFQFGSDIDRIKTSYANALEDLANTAGESKPLFVDSGTQLGEAVANGIKKGIEENKKKLEAALKEALALEKELQGEIDKELDKQLKADDEKIKNQQKREFELKEFYVDLEKELDAELAKESDDLAKKDLDRIKKTADEEIKVKTEASKRIADERKRINEEIESTAFDLAGQFLSARIDRERDRLAEETQEKLDNVDAEYAARLKAAEGNAEETARLNKLIEAEKEKVKKAEFEKNKQIGIKEALINGAIAAIQALSNTILPFPTSLLALVPVAAQTALQVGLISSQSFDQGGFTGKSSMAPDRTGERPVGVVHEDEYVTPRRVLQTTRGRQLVSELETLRVGMGFRGRYPGLYAEGGFAVPNTGGAGTAQQIAIQNNLELSPEDIERIARAVESGSERGSQRGANDGFSRAALEQQRDIQLMQDLAI